MTIKLQYTLFILILHALLAGLVFYLLSDYKILFFPVEILLLFSLYLSYRIYHAFIQPLDLMSRGVDAIRDQDFNIKFLETGSKDMDKLINVYNEMIDNIREERTQAEAQHYFLQKLITASPAGIILMDYDQQITDINPRARQILGLSPTANTEELSDLATTFLGQVFQLKTGHPKVLAMRTHDKYKCEVSHFIHRGFQRKFVMIQELSREILEAEKSAYGKIIRMMAHEVNNSIGAINSILHSVSEFHPSEDPDIQESLRIATDRNERLNQFMKNFAKVIRVPEPLLKAQALHPLVQEIQGLMEPLARQHQVNIELQLSSQNLIASLDHQLMEQVLVNIIQNAIESIGEKGRIRISTLAQPLTLLIEDNGEGIAPDVHGKLFTPFFSTKVHGQGVGLTLIREILTRHQTTFSLRTRADGWTEFRIVFPT